MANPGCLPKYMAFTVLPKNNTVFDQASTGGSPWTITFDVGAYAWGNYDFTKPA
jgi:hypothetical protein